LRPNIGSISPRKLRVNVLDEQWSATAVRKRVAVTSRMRLDIEFSHGWVGAVADGETFGSSSVWTRPKPHLRGCGGGADENGGVFGSS